LAVWIAEGSGPYPILYAVLLLVMARVVRERPWKPPLKTMMFCFPVSWRASLTALSIASEPVTVGDDSGEKV
jgi:hypothetical protein